MTIRSRIQSWLGLDEIAIAISHVANSQQISDNIARRIESKLDRANITLTAISQGVGRTVSKLDTQFARDPQSPEMKAESDRLSDEVIRRLEAEAKAREPYNNV